jgi:glycosyltransferase involved in cell wall biosynthesis
MKISIITPSRNQGQYIEHCFRSIYGQTHKDIEHLVLDGLSTDETAEIAARYPSTFLQKKDTGPAQAINRGLEMVTGDIVCWLNSDDTFWSSKTLETIVRTFEEHPEVDVITGDGYMVDVNGKLLAPVIAKHDRLNAYWIMRGDYVLQPATFWRRNNHRLDESLHFVFDWKLWMDFWNSGLSVMYLPTYLACYRVQPSSLTHQDTAERRKEIYLGAKLFTRRPSQTVRCWIVWKLFVLSEAVKVPFIKKLTIRVNG